VVIKTFFYLQTMLMGFVDKHFLKSLVYHFFPNDNTLDIEIKSLDESSIKLGNKSFWVYSKKWLINQDIKKI
jgi:hypothetical protein